MFAVTRVGVFIEMGAVEIGESVFVAREVGRHPIEDDADAALVQCVHEEHEILRRPKTTCRCEIADGLIAPGAVERMLRDRQELDVGVAHVVNVIGQAVGQFPIGQPAVALSGVAHPRSEMDFINGDGRGERVASAAMGHPFFIVPTVTRQIPYFRRGFGRISQAKA